MPIILEVQMATCKLALVDGWWGGVRLIGGAIWLLALTISHNGMDLNNSLFHGMEWTIQFCKRSLAGEREGLACWTKQCAHEYNVGSEEFSNGNSLLSMYHDLPSLKQSNSLEISIKAKRCDMTVKIHLQCYVLPASYSVPLLKNFSCFWLHWSWTANIVSRRKLCP